MKSQKLGKFKCKKCGSQFTRYLSGEKKHKIQYCKRECYWSAQRGVRQSAELIEKRIAPQRGKEKSNKHRLNLSKALLGRVMSDEARQRMSETHKRLGTKPPRNPRKGAEHPFWKGGRCVRAKGYVFVKADRHPNKDTNGYVAEHRLIMERRLGRLLMATEQVHHKNGITGDNRIENLELWTRSHPSGQRVSDKLQWAIDFVATYYANTAPTIHS